MNDAYEWLGMERVLQVSEEELGVKFREAGKRFHPDAGGAEGAFASLRDAYALLRSPASRLKHWLELRGIAGGSRGIIDSQLMDCFSEVGAAIQQVEALSRKREDTKSLLAKALLENEVLTLREKLTRLITQMDTRIEEECRHFPELEKSNPCDGSLAWQIVRNLSFLEKWRAGLRASFSKLV